MAPELGAKRLQILKEVLKKSQNVIVLWNPAYTGMRARFNDTKKAAPAIGMAIRSLEVSDPRQMEAAFDVVPRDRPDGLVLLADPHGQHARAHRRIRPREPPAGDLRDPRVRRGRRAHLRTARMSPLSRAARPFTSTAS